MPLEAGEPAPAEGWFVPPAVMQEIVPCLDERFRSGAPLPPPPDEKNDNRADENLDASQ